MRMPRTATGVPPGIRSYEYDSAARREQYFGEMHWAIAKPWLEARLTR